MSELRLPQYDPAHETWHETENPLLPVELWAAFTEHAERRKINNMAAQVGCGKEDRDYLGKWSPDGSDNYLTTARTTVFKIQRKVIERHKMAPTAYDESEIMFALESRRAEKGMVEVERTRWIERLSLRCHLEKYADSAKMFGFDTAFVDANTEGVAESFETPHLDACFMRSTGMIGTSPEDLSWEEVRWHHYQAVATASSSVQDGDVVEATADEPKKKRIEDMYKYYISYSGRRRQFLRMHKTSGCWRRPGIDIKDYLYLSELQSGDAHAYCKDCWKGSRLPDLSKTRGEGEEESINSEEELPSDSGSAVSSVQDLT